MKASLWKLVPAPACPEFIEGEGLDEVSGRTLHKLHTLQKQVSKEKNIALSAGISLPAFCCRVCCIPCAVLFFSHF